MMIIDTSSFSLQIKGQYCIIKIYLSELVEGCSFCYGDGPSGAARTYDHVSCHSLGSLLSQLVYEGTHTSYPITLQHVTIT